METWLVPITAVIGHARHARRARRRGQRYRATATRSARGRVGADRRGLLSLGRPPARPSLSTCVSRSSAEVADPKRTRARTLAFWNGDGLGDNFEYDLSGTPCEHVVGNNLCYYPSNVQKTFPEDRGLARMGIESYVGIPVLESEGKVVGHLAALEVEPLEARLSPEWVLKIFAARTGAEIERRRAEIASAWASGGTRSHTKAAKGRRVGLERANRAFLSRPQPQGDPRIHRRRDPQRPGDVVEAHSSRRSPEGGRGDRDTPWQLPIPTTSASTAWCTRTAPSGGSRRAGRPIRDDEGNAVRLVGTDAEHHPNKADGGAAPRERGALPGAFEQANVGIAHVGIDGYWAEGERGGLQDPRIRP